MTDFYLSWNPICVWIAKKTTTHQLKGRRGYNNNDKHKREKKERGLALLFLSTDSLMVFCLLWVHLEGPKGDWDTKSEDPKGPQTEEVTRAWKKEDSTLVFFQDLEVKSFLTSFSLGATNCFWDFQSFSFVPQGQPLCPLHFLQLQHLSIFPTWSFFPCLYLWEWQHLWPLLHPS